MNTVQPCTDPHIFTWKDVLDKRWEKIQNCFQKMTEETQKKKYINVEYNMPYIDCMDVIQMWALF